MKPHLAAQGQALAVEDCFAPLLQWVRSWWVPTGGRELAQEPLVLAVDPTSKQDDLVALVISGVYRQHAIPVAWHIIGLRRGHRKLLRALLTTSRTAHSPRSHTAPA